MNVNVGTSLSGRGQRGIEIDAKEFIAMRNIVHFNCANPFNQFGVVAKQGPEKELTAVVKEQDSPLKKGDRSFFSKNPYGDISQVGRPLETSTRIEKKDMFVMV